MIQGDVILQGGASERLSAPVPDDECGDTIIRAIRHEARSSGLGDVNRNVYTKTQKEGAA
jgi:hypothetical protein